MDKLISELYTRLSDEPAPDAKFYMQIAYNEGVGPRRDRLHQRHER